MTFDQLLATIRTFPVVTDDTRELVAGGVFVYGGGRDRREEFLDEALAKGAALIVSEETLPQLAPAQWLQVPSRRAAAAELARAFYGDPSLQLRVIGVTGTCGKTTSTFLLEALLQAAGHAVGVIGTENIRYTGRVFPAPNTTPSTFVLNRTLRAMVDAGCTALAMEVSSHALEQGRVLGVAFDAMLFTNLSVEHLDLHGTMENYFAAKSRLFTDCAAYARTRGKTPRAAVNLDDAYGTRLYQCLRDSPDFAPQGPLGFSRHPLNEGVDGSALQASADGIHGVAVLRGDGMDQPVAVAAPLIGDFNVENVLAAVAVGLQLGVDADALARGLRAVQRVPGRMQRVAQRGGVAVVVDFAHKPGALDVVLATLRPLTAGRLICVFGCGGRRDASKRPVMGRMAAQRADIVIVAPDNSRGEPFATIAADILAGVDAAGRARMQTVDDRREAIRAALNQARRGDTVLIAGRGAESELSIDLGDGRDRQIAFDDRVVAAALAAELLAD